MQFLIFPWFQSFFFSSSPHVWLPLKKKKLFGKVSPLGKGVIKKDRNRCFWIDFDVVVPAPASPAEHKAFMPHAVSWVHLNRRPKIKNKLGQNPSALSLGLDRGDGGLYFTSAFCNIIEADNNTTGNTMISSCSLSGLSWTSTLSPNCFYCI